MPADSGDRRTGTQPLERPATTPPDGSDNPTAAVPVGTAGNGTSGKGTDTAVEDTAGEDTAGEDTAGEDTAGEDTAGEDTAGEETAGEETAGGETAGGETAGGETAGGETAGGETAGGETAGGETAGGETAAEEPAAEEPSGDDAVVEDAAGDEPAGDEPAGDDDVVEAAAVDDTAGDDAAGVDAEAVPVPHDDTTADDTVADDTAADDAAAVDAATVPVAVATVPAPAKDSVGIDTARVDTARVDTARVDTARVDTARVDRDDRVSDDTAGEGPGGTPSRWPWVLAGSLVLLAVVYAGAAWAVSGRVPAGVSVGGSEIGGSSRAAAVETLTADLGPRSEEPIALTVGTATAQLDPATSGLSLDVEGTVDELVGFSLDPRDLWRHLAGDSDIAPVVSADEPALTDALETVAGEVESEPVAGAVTFTDGTAEPTPAVEGRALDVAGAADVVTEEWLTAPAPAPAIELPADVVAPEVDQAAVDEALTSFATPATSGPLTVAVPGRSVALEPAEFAPALAMEAVEGRLEPRLDGAVLLAVVLAKDPQIVTAPQDATVRLEGGGPVVVPAVNGTGIDPGALAEVVLPALTAPERTAEVEPVPAEPEVTTADAEALGVREPISEFATKLTPDAGRTENITIAAGTVNGTLLLPGETFSLNDTLGRRTPEKGYNEAPVIENGRLTRDFGGGVSQMATTLFNGMFFAGLEDIEHKPHSFYISRYPEGREATVNFDNVDLEFRNDSPYGVLIETYVGGGQVHTRFWSTKVWDEIRADKSPRTNIRQPESITDPAPECVSQEAQVGFDVTVTRSFVRGGAVERTEEFNTRYNAEDEVRCTG